MENPIPSQVLMHNSEKVFFAFRTMEENHIRANGKPDVPHRHEFYTILLVRNACGTHVVDYTDFYMKPGTVFLLSPGQVHQVISNCEPSGDIIMFNDEFLDRNYVNHDFISNLELFSENTTTPPLYLPDEAVAKLSEIAAQIKTAFEGDSSFKFDIIASYLKLFLIECNTHALPSKSNNPQTIQTGRLLIKQFKALLEEKFRVWHKVNEYADKLSITPDYLNNIVKDSVGKTAKEMILSRIVLEAKRLGLHSGSTSKEIAYSLGFDDPSHFSKLFKNESGQSFTEFRTDLDKKLKPVLP
jgi:AraC family transcriptional regulator, transcriptional activator of pobA